MSTGMPNEQRNRFVPHRIYRHFKGDHYASIGTSRPVPRDELWAKANTNFFTNAVCSETRGGVILFKDEETGEYLHSIDDNDKVVAIYIALYGHFTTYIRDIDMFVSKTDKEKHKDATQDFRFEIVYY
jgi:hypothetical protein